LSSAATIACFIHGEIPFDGTMIRACEPRRIASTLTPSDA
jgi:hypothetical protein